MNKEIIQKLIEEFALIKFSHSGNYYHKIDNNGTWILDFRRAFLNPKVLQKFCEYFWDIYEPCYPFQIGGIESGGIPFVTGIILEGLKRGKEVNGFYVRKTRKEKGLGNIIEGNLNDEKIIIVDDVLNGGQSLYAILKSLSSFNKEIYKAFVFVNFGNPSGHAIIKENSVDLSFVFSLSDFGIQDYVDGGFSNYPIVYPKFKRIFQMPHQNLFIDVPKSNPILYNDGIVVGGEGGSIYFIHRDTGDIIWKKQIPTTLGHKNILSSPFLIGEQVVFGAYDGNIYFLSVINGETIRVIETHADFIGATGVYDYQKGILFFGCEHAGVGKKGSLLAYDYRNHIILWEKTFSDFVHSSPGISQKKEMVVCASNDGKIIGVKYDGTIIFDLQLNAPVKGGFVFDDKEDNVFFGTHDFNFYKINVESGKIIFEIGTENIIYTHPLIIGDHIFFGGLDKKFYHISGSTGDKIKVISTSGKIFSQPTSITDTILVFASNDGFIYFYDFHMGKIVYTIFHGEKINNKMLFDKEYGFLYVVDHVGGIYKYSISKFLT